MISVNSHLHPGKSLTDVDSVDVCLAVVLTNQIYNNLLFYDIRGKETNRVCLNMKHPRRTKRSEA